ncbi:hypothetical protein NC651_002147 [Populus alba x Populus x berolinensis]|nr:hypothetical protein NC651_002147 [Populus alba x Populus x berolinensis]
MHIIAHQKHHNLPPLLAYSYSKDEQLLVSEERTGFHVGGAARLSIARGTARALEYLHTSATNSKSVVPHGNLKSTNVLLDCNGMDLISDYGLSSLKAQSIAAQNLVSYKPPGYQTTKKVSNIAYSGMLKLLQIASRCCDKFPYNRPEMTEVENIKAAESEDEEFVDQSDESLRTSASLINNDIKLSD